MATKAISSVFRHGLFDGKVAIVTGGGTGIGNAITRELLYLGCNVVIAARKFDRLEKEAQILNSRFPNEGKPKVLAVQCNIRKEEEVKGLMEQTLANYGKIDFLVNNSGGQFPGPASNVSLKGWNAVIETNLTGTFLMLREAYDNWMCQNGGAIVNIVSDMFRGFAIMAHSGAARAGVDNLTKSLSIEWAQNGIRINSVAPGSSIWSETAAKNYADPALFHKTIPGIPAKRFGRTEEVSAAVAFLLSPAAAFITGETIRIDGGASLYSQSFWEIPEHKNMPAYTWEEDSKNKSKL